MYTYVKAIATAALRGRVLTVLCNLSNTIFNSFGFKCIKGVQSKSYDR